MSLQNLNPEQLEAVKHTQGPLLVLAGAGTGKTRVLTSRIIHIINSYLASPWQILAVTFTNKAAAEMKKRIGEVIGDQVQNLWVGTFHSIASRILRRHPEIVGLRSDFTIIDDDDQLRLLKQILTDLNIDSKQFAAKTYLAKISRLKDKMITAINFDKLSDQHNQTSSGSLPKLKAVYEIYQSRLQAMNAADFGDLLLHNLTLFQSAPEVLSQYQDKFRYILVDEYQDTNNAQYNWLLRLSSSHKNICAVGDDDQSIYSWRGANIANILRFEKDFLGAKVIRLEQNYRSSANILEAAYSVISNNKERHGKKLWTEAGQGEKVRLLSFLDDRMEASTIAGLITNFAAEKKFQFSQIAILVRAGYQTRAFEEAFIQSSIPYKIIGGMKFYERMEIRDSLAYLRACANFDDNLALSRIINVPKRGVGEVAIANLYQMAKQEKISLFAAIKKSLEENLIKGKARESLSNLIIQLEKFHTQIGNLSLSELAKLLLEEVGYIQMWKSENSLESQGRIENITEFVSSLAEFTNMVEFLEYVSLVEAREDKNLFDAVSMMTVHAAKGLEFDLVFVPGLEDGVFPSAKSMEDKNGLEEERRLVYVAITRARKQLVLSHAKNRYVFGDYQNQLPSRFIQELPQSEIETEEVFFGTRLLFENKSTANQPKFQSKSEFNYKPISQNNSFKNDFGMIGQRVFHQKFGYGKVLSEDGNRLEINFEKGGKKVIMKDFIKFMQ